ncbi:sigma factor, partial [Mycobacterium avium]|uniref:sigma factor n=1 Tax=Mycobacterium avium TaxID=1764 RepID=UPI000AFE811D
RHRPYLVNLAYQMLGDIGDAEDVAQEAFLRLSAAGDIDDVRGWLLADIARTFVSRAGRAQLVQAEPAGHH